MASLNGKKKPKNKTDQTANEWCIHSFHGVLMRKEVNWWLLSFLLLSDLKFRSGFFYRWCSELWTNKRLRRFSGTHHCTYSMMAVQMPHIAGNQSALLSSRCAESPSEIIIYIPEQHAGELHLCLFVSGNRHVRPHTFPRKASGDANVGALLSRGSNTVLFCFSFFIFLSCWVMHMQHTNAAFIILTMEVGTLPAQQEPCDLCEPWMTASIKTDDNRILLVFAS